MVYMVVEEHTKDILHLTRSPGIRSWSLLVGIASVGLAAAYYSPDNFLWKLFYLAGCVFIALQNMEVWEDAVFDKTKGVIELTTFNLYAMVLTMFKEHDRVVLDLKHLRDISVHEEKVRYLGKGYVLVLRMATGFSYPLTHSATLKGRSDVEEIAGLIKRFLELKASPLNQEDQTEDFEQLGVDGDDESSDSSDSLGPTNH